MDLDLGVLRLDLVFGTFDPCLESDCLLSEGAGLIFERVLFPDLVLGVDTGSILFVFAIFRVFTLYRFGVFEIEIKRKEEI